jgi:hypothetical protein
MITSFEKIPDLFIELYDAQFQIWAREFRARGRYAAIVFNRPPGTPMEMDAEGQPVWHGCWLAAEIDRGLIGGPRVVIRPRTDHDAEMIERHCREMAAHVLH